MVRVVDVVLHNVERVSWQDALLDQPRDVVDGPLLASPVPDLNAFDQPCLGLSDCYKRLSYSVDWIQKIFAFPWRRRLFGYAAESVD